MKKAICFFCAALLTVCCSGVLAGAAAEENEHEGGFQYELNGGHISLYYREGDHYWGPGLALYESADLSGDVVLPETIDGKPLSLIFMINPPNNVESHYYCLCDNPEMTSITFPATVIAIGIDGQEGILGGCSSLTTITFQGNGPEVLPAYVFNYLPNLKRIVLPKNVKELQPYFCPSEHLQELVLDPGNPYLVKDDQGIVYNREMTKVITAVEGADSRTEVTLPDTVTEIGKLAFLNNRKLTTIHGLSHVKKVSEDSFANCDSFYRFWDTKGHWAKEEIDWVNEQNILMGTSVVAFSPNLPMDRGMLMTTLYRMEGEPFDFMNHWDQVTMDPFSDVSPSSSKYFSVPVYWARSVEIATGLTPTIFGPSAPVTREQLAAFLYRYADYKKDSLVERGDLSVFQDAASVSDYAREAMEWAVGRGLLQGKSGGKLDPKGKATRAEVSVILYRYLAGQDS